VAVVVVASDGRRPSTVASDGGCSLCKIFGNNNGGDNSGGDSSDEIQEI